MKIFITGINGFVGSYLVEYLVKYYPKSRIYGLIRNRGNQKNLLESKNKIKLIEADLLDSKKINQTIKSVRPDWVFHLAAQMSSRFMKEADEQMLDINIIGTLNLLKAIKNNAPKAKFLFISSAAVYGNQANHCLPIKESCPAAPIDAYGASKACAEILCQQYFKIFELPVLIARTFNILAPVRAQNFLEKNFVPQIKSIKLFQTPPIINTGDLTSERDFLDIRDIIRAYITLMHRGHPGEIYNICSGKARRMDQLSDLLIKYSGLKGKVKVIRDPRYVRAIDIKKSLGSNAKLKRHTGWSPKISLEKTLMDMLKHEGLLFNKLSK